MLPFTISVEVDMDVDSFNTFEVDKLNVIALDYDMPAGAFSKYVYTHTLDHSGCSMLEHV